MNDEEKFIESLLTNSLFEDEKTILIKRVNDKIINIIQNIEIDQLDNILIIIDSENLDKRSKLRSFFEKSKNFLCIPFYPDNDTTLSKLTYDFFGFMPFLSANFFQKE